VANPPGQQGQTADYSSGRNSERLALLLVDIRRLAVEIVALVDEALLRMPGPFDG